MGNLGQHAAAVAEHRVGADRAAMIEVDEDLQPLFEDRMRLAVLHVGDEADAARVVLVGGVVETLGAGQKRVSAAGQGSGGVVAEGGRGGGAGVHLSTPRPVAGSPASVPNVFWKVFGQLRLGHWRAADVAGRRRVTRPVFFGPFCTSSLSPR